MNDRDYTPIVLLKRHWQQIGMLIFSCLVCGVSYFINYTVHQKKSRENQLYTTQAQTNREAAESTNILKRYYPRYEAYVSESIIGKSNRLQQIETIKALGEKLALPGVSFSVEENNYATPNNYYLSDEYIHLQFSLMRIDFTLDHEAQFQLFMDGLDKYAKGVFSAQQCELRRSDDTNFDDSSLELKGSCDLHWYLLKDITDAWRDHELAGQ